MGTQLANALELIFRFLREQEDIEVLGRFKYHYLTAFKKPTGQDVYIKVVDKFLVPPPSGGTGRIIRGLWIETKRPINRSWVGVEGPIGDTTVKCFELHDPNSLQKLADLIRER
jgi:hypothetical protein